MIASRRLSPVWHVAGVALAALVCYLVSQSVAAERASLNKVNRQIVAEQDAIAKLSTEIATRSRLTQIESWNRQLALQAPRPGQYVENGVQLASLYAHDAGPQLPLNPAVVAPHGPLQAVSLPAPAQAAPVQAASGPAQAAPTPTIAAPPAPARVVMAAAAAPARKAPALIPAVVVKPVPTRAPLQQVAYTAPASPPSKTKAPVDLLPQPLLRTAAYVRPQASPLDDAAPAATPVAFHLSDDIAHLARAEQAKHKNKAAK
jgi:heme exporter protein D